ncbi:MAG: acyl-ACP--UDP-N-acetylglucosamine O-acyltransferase [Holosporales bacterium]|jgi:UDP-N-acetylglucosamine acyltransferase|nr:acyl-ACP--UDP-N-acetylglucosamine O-acyltransferase [Holosporales bacterium]
MRENVFIHQTAIVEEGATIGTGSYIGPYCCIGKDVIMGNDVRLESHVVISGDTKIGDRSTVSPFASLGQQPQDLKYKGERSCLEIGCDTTIREYVTANIGTEGGGMITKIGDHCLIMAYCHVAHDCVIGDHVILANGVNLSGHVTIGNYAVVGGMSVVKQFIRIGQHAMIGGFTGVDRDVIPYGMVRSDRVTTIKGLNIVGLKRHGFNMDEIKTMLAVYCEIFTSEAGRGHFTKNAEEVRLKYLGNRQVEQIVKFIINAKKNPICTTEPIDSSPS